MTQRLEDLHANHCASPTPLRNVTNCVIAELSLNELCRKKTLLFAYEKTKAQISFAVAAQLIRAFVLANR